MTMKDSGTPSPATEDERGTILLVEDDEDSRIIYSTVLRHIGHHVVEAVTGAEAITKAREVHPDVILMDVSIPVIDGWEATRMLKRDPATAHIPIIALTAHGLESDRLTATEVGCYDYLVKPHGPGEVAAAVERCLDITKGVEVDRLRAPLSARLRSAPPPGVPDL